MAAGASRSAAGRAVSFAAVCALSLAGSSLVAGCSSSDEPDPGPDGGLVSVTTMRGAFLQASEIGPTWAAPEESAAPAQTLVSFCGATSTPPEVPPGAELVSSSLADEGQTGAQTLHQTALVYPDAASAQAGLALLRTVAGQCPPSAEVPATVTADRNEPAFTETAEVRELNEGGWTGFVIVRHKNYEAAHPGTADTAVAVLTSRNVVIVDTYAIYRLDSASASPNFEADWQRLVGSVVQRVG
ncbi:hypothetical protein AMIS_51010 [Actinoplanes missouriensis 431]|uniref:PknH-like extracellular domain-containing protein n=1 Tax=Actinoplanes missouriensis (strain ATCC 14538 / DSM 43046 / CBS 188.64 / JCM 3121 / NBRC 102363 / NCIMB 12654 / NRRL B-3342 / UNCC 431) TaxID=512565 RepID=I0HBD4_ACTM4|nr:hypothetical protein [Actinoplanes missouriensis]BAL90321.1 hypothetical protein AMIS_51010 [Actinoplanes missouriensis 431]